MRNKFFLEAFATIMLSALIFGVFFTFIVIVVALLKLLPFVTIDADTFRTVVFSTSIALTCFCMLLIITHDHIGKEISTCIKFKSKKFPAYEGELESPYFEDGIYGKRLAEYLRDHLPDYGITVLHIDYEDWGWRVDIDHPSKANIWIGCQSYGYEGENAVGYCVVHPTKNAVRKYFIKIINVEKEVLDIAKTIRGMFAKDPEVIDVRRIKFSQL